MSKPIVSRILFWTVFLALCLVHFQAIAQTQLQPTEEGRVTLDFKDVELTDLIQTISELTGENFLYDDSVKGKVTIISPESMTLDEAYQLFHTVLNVKGYTVVPSGEVNKIVPLKRAKESNLPTIINGRGHPSEQFITRVFRLEHIDASIIGPTVLIPLMPKAANVSAYAPSNSLIITDTGANIERLAKIIRELDQPDSAGLIEIVPLVNSSAEVLAKILNEIMAQPVVATASRRKAVAAGAGNVPVIKIIPYPAGRSLILLADRDNMAIIKGLIAKMDQDIVGTRSNINLFYLENADAVTLAATLNEILTGIKTQTRVAGQSQSNKNPLSSGPVTITADKPTNSLIINASPDNYRTLEEIITKLDIKRKQVYVEVLILELSMDATQRLGVSLQGAANIGDDSLIIGSSNQNTGPVGIGDAIETGAAGLPSLLTQAIDGLLVGGFFNPITVTGPDGVKRTVPSLSVLIDISKTDSDVNLLSAPRLLTSDNEEAEIIVGANVPIITGRLTDSGSDGLAQSVSVERQDVALILRLTPQITEGDLVRLKIYQEITDIAPATLALVASVGNPSEVGPTFTKRVLRSTVVVENNRTVVLGGLIDTNVSETVTKVPLLGDLPLIGWLFRRTSTQEEKTNLLIFINPTIIKNAEDLERVTGRNRTAAKGFLTEKVINAVPENFFGEMGAGSPGVTEGTTETENTTESGSKIAPPTAGQSGQK
jgi:general secretion pathway protein D